MSTYGTDPLEKTFYDVPVQSGVVDTTAIVNACFKESADLRYEVMVRTKGEASFSATPMIGVLVVGYIFCTVREEPESTVIKFPGE